MNGRILKQLREERRITQDEMANALHVTKRAYAGWERGERDVSTDTLCQMADFFGVSTDYILGRVPMDIEIKKETPPELPEGVQEIRAVVSAAADQPQLDAALEAAVRRIVRQELHRQDSES